METRQDLTQSTGVPVDQATANFTISAPDLVSGRFAYLPGRSQNAPPGGKNDY